MHTVMAIVYGAFLARFVPELVLWMDLETGFARGPEVSGSLRAAFLVCGCGVLLSGARDFGAACGIRWLRTPLLGAR